MLKAKLAASERRRELVAEFLTSYQLSEGEVEALSEGEVRQRTAAEPLPPPPPVVPCVLSPRHRAPSTPLLGLAAQVGDEFFAALERVRQIHTNCRSLLHGAHQRAGLEIMDAMGGYQEAAYEKLCRWVQHECRALSADDAPEVDEGLQRAAAALQQRPVLFKVWPCTASRSTLLLLVACRGGGGRCCCCCCCCCR